MNAYTTEAVCYEPDPRHAGAGLNLVLGHGIAHRKSEAQEEGGVEAVPLQWKRVVCSIGEEEAPHPPSPSAYQPN